jgi:hypothetical protein
MEEKASSVKGQKLTSRVLRDRELERILLQREEEK